MALTDYPTIFVDTSFFKAIIDAKDDFHQKATKILEELKKKGAYFVTSNFILDESFTLIRIKCGLEFVLEFKKYLAESSMVLNIARVTVADEALAWEYFIKDWSKLSFTDCTSFAMMKRLNIKKALVFDDHFRRAGFQII